MANYMYLIRTSGQDLSLFKPTCRNVCGFFATATHTLPQRVGAQTISGIRVYAGYNNNPLSADPANNGQHRCREMRQKGDIQ